MADAVVRVSVLRCDPADFQRFRDIMADSVSVLRPGIESMTGLPACYAGADEATRSFTNTSGWETLEDARQLDHFEPMLTLRKRFASEGARFDWPIMNDATMWKFGPLAAE